MGLTRVAVWYSLGTWVSLSERIPETLGITITNRIHAASRIIRTIRGTTLRLNASGIKMLTIQRLTRAPRTRGIATVSSIEIYFAVNNLFRFSAWDKTRRSVPVSFSPETPRNASSRTYRLKTTLIMNAQSNSGTAGILKFSGSAGRGLNWLL